MQNNYQPKGVTKMKDNHDETIKENINKIHAMLNILKMFSSDISNANLIKLPGIGHTPVENSIYLGVMLKNIEHIIDIYKSGIDKMHSLEHLLTTTIEKILESHNINEINDSEDIKIRYRKCPEKLVIFDEDKLKYYFIEKKEIILDKKAVIRDLKEGKYVDGAHLKRERKVEVKFKPVIVKK